MTVQGGAGQVDRGRLGLKALSVLVELLSLIPEQSFERLAPEMKQLMEAIAHATVVLGSTHPAGVYNKIIIIFCAFPDCLAVRSVGAGPPEPFLQHHCLTPCPHLVLCAAHSLQPALMVSVPGIPALCCAACAQ